MKEQHHKHIQQTLNSMEGIQKAEASPFLYGRIMERMRQQVTEPVYYSGKVLIRFAVMVMVIMAVNVVTVKVFKNKPVPKMNEQMELQHMAQEYFGFENTDVYNY